VVLVDDADCLHPGIHDPPYPSAAAGFFSTIGACRALRVAPAKVAAPKDNGGSSGATENFCLSLPRLLWLHLVGRRNEDGGRP
jgi:hypothetical protein